MNAKLNNENKNNQTDEKLSWYMKMIDPQVLDSFTFEQYEEVKRVFTRVAFSGAVKMLDIRLSFWFIKNIYLVLFLGEDTRKNSRDSIKIGERSIQLPSLARVIFSLVILILIMAFVFLILYAIKSSSGIDLFPDKHLKDVIAEWLA